MLTIQSNISAPSLASSISKSKSFSHVVGINAKLPMMDKESMGNFEFTVVAIHFRPSKTRNDRLSSK